MNSSPSPSKKKGTGQLQIKMNRTESNEDGQAAQSPDKGPREGEDPLRRETLVKEEVTPPPQTTQ